MVRRILCNKNRVRAKQPNVRYLFRLMKRILSNILNEILAIYPVNSFNFRLMFSVQSCITTKLTLYILFVFYFWQIEYFANGRVCHSLLVFG